MTRHMFCRWTVFLEVIEVCVLRVVAGGKPRKSKYTSEKWLLASENDLPAAGTCTMMKSKELISDKTSQHTQAIFYSRIRDSRRPRRPKL